ncbi:MAG: hypothetical protein L6Q35_08865 [Phycisphaerales bacterium]|nr:hypothetical protein [Phycisphaerales bacterium]
MVIIDTACDDLDSLMHQRTNDLIDGTPPCREYQPHRRRHQAPRSLSLGSIRLDRRRIAIIAFHVLAMVP